MCVSEGIYIYILLIYIASEVHLLRDSKMMIETRDKNRRNSENQHTKKSSQHMRTENTTKKKDREI